MGKFVKRRVMVQAMQWNGINFEEIRSFTNTRAEMIGANLFIRTLEGNMCAPYNAWIIKGVEGEFYPCPADVFKDSYESEGANFVKRRVWVDATQWIGTNQAEAEAFVGPMAEVSGQDFLIKRPDGTMTAKLKDWIIKGVKGEFYPCEEKIFDKTYQPVGKCSCGSDIVPEAKHCVACQVNLSL